MTLRKKCPYSELFWSAFSCIRTRITPNTGTFYTVWVSCKSLETLQKLCLSIKKIHIRNLGKITVFYAVLDELVSLGYSLVSSNIIAESFKNVNNYISTSITTSLMTKKFCFTLKRKIILPMFLLPLMMLKWKKRQSAKSNIWDVFATIDTV